MKDAEIKPERLWPKIKPIGLKSVTLSLIQAQGAKALSLI
jgi:hypothetical protein